MDFLRKAAVVLALGLLPAALFSFGLLFSVYQIFGNPDHLKKALADSGVYEAAIAQLAGEPQGHAIDTSGEGEVPAGQRVMQDAVREAMPPAYLEQTTDQVLDSVYAWLQGKEGTLAFEIQLEPVKEKLVTSITEQAKERARTLPACAAPVPPDYDVFNAECVPPGVTPEAIAEQTRRQVLASELFKDPTLTAEDLKSEDGRTLEDRLKIAADTYQKIKDGIIISGLSALALILIVVFLSDPRRIGVRRAAISFISVGSILAILTLIGNFLVRAIAKGIAESSGESVQAKAAVLVRILASDIQPYMLGFGILLVVAGIGALIAIHVTEPATAGPGQAAGRGRSTSPSTMQAARGSKQNKKSRA
jgi:hypothetical protein